MRTYFNPDVHTFDALTEQLDYLASFPDARVIGSLGQAALLSGLFEQRGEHLLHTLRDRPRDIDVLGVHAVAADKAAPFPIDVSAFNNLGIRLLPDQLTGQWQLKLPLHGKMWEVSAEAMRPVVAIGVQGIECTTVTPPMHVALLLAYGRDLDAKHRRVVEQLHEGLSSAEMSELHSLDFEPFREVADLHGASAEDIAHFLKS